MESESDNWDVLVFPLLDSTFQNVAGNLQPHANVSATLGHLKTH